MESKNYLKDISDIKQMMDKSSRFISLSGLSGILAGLYAIIGASVAYWLVKTSGSDDWMLDDNIYTLLMLDLFLVALLSIATGVVMSTQKAKEHGAKIWDSTSRRLVINFAIPLIVGGLYILIMLMKDNYEQSGSLMLIFYGLALITASKYSIGDIRYLGLIDAGLGLLAALFPEYSFWLWVMGFGLMHIVYGTWMHFKYDVQKN